MAKPAFEMDHGLRSLLAGQLSRGELVLFTGAGFSLQAPCSGGGTVPSVAELRELLSAIGLPGQPLDTSSSLGDLYACALDQGGKRTREIIESRFRVTGNIPESYRRWFSQPWHRIYTLNIDDLDEALNRSNDLPFPIRAVSAISEGFGIAGSDVLSVHLNGTVADFPDITFSPGQYGERLARPDSWYTQLVSDLMASPVLFVGTELNEPPLWQHLELRGKRGPGPENRPRSYLIAPDLPIARRAMLRKFNVEWIPLGHGEFMDQILWSMEHERDIGIGSIRKKRGPARATDALLKVSELRTQPSENVREFLMGRQPEWADLTDEGFAVVRSFEASLSKSIRDAAPKIIVLTGTAGSGKSTTLMRLGIEFHADSHDVRWLDLNDEVALVRLRDEVRRESPGVLLIDELELLGQAAGSFLSELVDENPDLLVIAALRSSRYQGLEAQMDMADGAVLEYTIPNLDDSDIDVLLSALEAAGKLGRLRGMDRNKRVAALRHEAGRQLLVAMLQATSGKRFDEKICDEVRDLDHTSAAIYGTVALATHVRTGLTRHEIMLAAGEPSNESAAQLQRLLDRHILLLRGELIVTRHRLIAERVVGYLKAEGRLGEVTRGVAFVLATAVNPGTRPSRPHAILTRLINHDWLIRNFNGEWDVVRSIYDRIEPLLQWDHHYWLQRGSFEVEKGDPRAAENYLESARSMAPTDYRVQTEWAYMILRQATTNPGDVGLAQLAVDAFDELEDAISRRGDSDPYPFHIMGAHGLEFIETASLGRDEKLKFVTRIRLVVEDGRRRHPKDEYLIDLAKRLERLFLTVGAVRGPAETS